MSGIGGRGLLKEVIEDSSRKSALKYISLWGVFSKLGTEDEDDFSTFEVCCNFPGDIRIFTKFSFLLPGKLRFNLGSLAIAFW